MQKQNYKLAWQYIAEDSKKKKWHDFKMFKEHSNKHIFNENRIGLLEAKIVRCDIIENVSGEGEGGKIVETKKHDILIIQLHQFNKEVQRLG